MQPPHPATAEPLQTGLLGRRLQRVRGSRLVRQNLVLFAGGIVAGMGSFVYHAVAGRALGPRLYGEVASLFALYIVGTAINLILILVLARYAAGLVSSGRDGGLPSIMRRTGVLLAGPAVALVLLSVGLSVPVADFLHLSSPVPVVWLGVALAGCWYLAIPRGVQQGIQMFGSLSANLSMELVVRTSALALLLWAGLSVTGSMIALLVGVSCAFGLGLWSLRHTMRLPTLRVRMRDMLGFALTAAAGTLGVLLLYNLDVVLAAHFLNKHDAGIYGGLSKLGGIVYFGTLSVSQVLFPRVLEAIATRRHPGRLLLLSAGLIVGAGLCAVAVFATLAGLVVGILYGPAFSDAQAYLLLVGLNGLGLSLNNLLIQFFIAIHDRTFIWILAAGCLLEAVLIWAFHDSVGQVVHDVLTAMGLLLVGLALRCLQVLQRLRPWVLEDAGRASSSPD